jgi:hypothetical protein
MRLWSLHPKYLDARGLVALWREALLAQAVLQGKTKGYQNHPQLARFRSHPNPVAAIATYLRAVHAESIHRGYSFDATKIGKPRTSIRIACTEGQLRYEWEHLKKKLKTRNPVRYHELLRHAVPEVHPLFTLIQGERESWEVVRAPKQGTAGKAREKSVPLHKIP